MELEDIIDHRTDATHSVVQRYAGVFRLLRPDLADALAHFPACSQREGIQSVELEPYRGVSITVVDESSLMTTGTYKDLDACIISAILRASGIRRVIISSGGNLATALASYARDSELEVIAFIPRTTLDKLEGAHFDHPGVTVICVDMAEKQVKSLASEFAREHGILEVPDVRWRLAASAFRAMFLLEHVLDPKIPASQSPAWIAQTMCAGYGPTGIYSCFAGLKSAGLAMSEPPRFLGFQQEANCPMVRAWQANQRQVSAQHVNAAPDQYLEPVLYNTNPGPSYSRLYDLMKRYGGTLESISADDFSRYATLVTRRLADQGLVLSARPDTGEIVERTGLLTGVGALGAIDRGIVQPGERLIVLLTGGIRPDPRFDRVTPSIVVDDSLDQNVWVERLGKRLGFSRDRRGLVPEVAAHPMG